MFAMFLANAQQKSPQQFLSEIIQIPSISGNEKKVAEHIIQFCRQEGLYIEIFSGTDSSYNFSASLFPLSSNKPNIVLLSHLDVVPASDSNSWQHPPFSGEVLNGEIWGRGAIDAKGLLVMQLYGLLAYKKTMDSTNPYNITVLGVSGEETGGKNGSIPIVEHHWDQLHPIVVFGEGGSGVNYLLKTKKVFNVFGVSIAEKSNLLIQLTSENYSVGHSAVPPSLYANKRLLRALIRIMDDYELPKFDKLTLSMFRTIGDTEKGTRKFVMKHINWKIFYPFVKEHFREGELLHTLVYNTYVITHISNSSSANNQIAAKATAILDCRLLPEMDHRKFINKIKRLAGAKIKVQVLDESPDAKPSSKDQFYTAMEIALKSNFPNSTVVPVLIPATTDNNFYRLKGINVFGIIPVLFDEEELNSIHNRDERIKIESIRKGIDVFKDMFQLLQK